MSAHRSALPPPPIGGLALELFRFEGLRARFVLGIYGVGLLLFAMVMLRTATRTGELTLRPVDLGGLLRSLLFAMGIVWAARSPTLTAYPLSLPVNRVPHVALRVLMSWSWAMLAAGATVFVLFALVLVTDGSVATHQPALEYDTAGYQQFIEASNAVRERFGQPMWEIPVWAWFAPFAGATALFLLMAALLLWVDRNPGLGMLVLTLGLTGVGALLFPERVETFLAGRFGMETLLSGSTRSVHEVLHLSSGDLVIYSVAPDLPAWLVTFALWALLGLAALIIALRRRRDL